MRDIDIGPLLDDILKETIRKPYGQACELITLVCFPQVITMVIANIHFWASCGKNTTFGTECLFTFCAGSGPLHLGVVIVLYASSLIKKNSVF